MKTIIVLSLALTTLLSAKEDSRWINHKDYRLDRPIAKLTDSEQDLFTIGRSFFSIPWVEAPSATTARDGLGPLFNANTCTSCHRGNGVGEKYNQNGQLSRAMITKLSRKNGQRVPYYGGQIAINGTIDTPFEAQPTLTETAINIRYPDGQQTTLYQPSYGLSNLSYGDLPEDILIVQRRAPALIGLGLLSQVSDETILAQADPNDTDNNGISGKPNWIPTANGGKRLGRFTAKASAVSVIEQSAIAASQDMGLSNPLFPQESCEKEQTACLAEPRGRPAPNGQTLDLPMPRLAAIAHYLQHTQIPIPKPDKAMLKGKQLFQTMGCSECHLSTMQTSDGITFSPYTDLLLHDMGEGLADGRHEFSANGNEFRTAPLWGLSTYAKTLTSKTPYYLHDGRARTLEEAILWHDGEAKASKQRFMDLSAEKRQAIIDFLNHL